MNNPDKSNHAKGLLALSVLCGATVQSQSVEAAIYTYVDSDGTRWLTNAPKKGNQYKLVAKYGAPQKSLPKAPQRIVSSYPAQGGYSSAGAYTTASLTMTNPANFGGNAGIAPRHCGGQTLAQLDRKLDPHLDSIRTFSRSYGVEENLIRAVMKQESCFNPAALSRAGAIGLMQLMPGTADHLGVDNAWDPHQNIGGGVKYLAQMLREFNGDKALALAAYNAGPGAVRKYNGIPPYTETRNYVQRIMAEYNRLQGVQTVAANGYQRNARVTTAGSRGYGWAKPVQEFSVFRGRS